MLLNIGSDQRIRLLPISHSLSGFGAVLGLGCILSVHACGMCAVSVRFVCEDFCPLSNSVLSDLNWRWYYCPLASHFPSLKTWLCSWFQISVTAGLLVALITRNGCDAASCWLHWPQFGRPSGVLAAWLETFWCMLLGHWHVQPVILSCPAGWFQHCLI